MLRQPIVFGFLVFTFVFGGCTEALGPVEDDSVGEEGQADPGSGPGSDSGSEASEGTANPSTFNPGPYGVTFRSVAGGFTLQTIDGVFDFEESWTGDDSYLFLQYTNAANQSTDLVDYLNNLWFAAGSSRLAVRELIENSPKNVHYFFTSFDSDADVDVTRMRDGFEEVLGGLSDEDQAHWRGRFHFVTQPARQATGWLGDVFAEAGWLWFGIDRYQRFRQVGMMTDIGTNKPRMANLAYEAQYYNFEYEREERLRAEEGVTVVTVFDGEHVGTKTVDVDFPAAADMAGFDTMELDVSAYCPDNSDSNCGEWDYLSNMDLCDRPLEATNPHANTTCTAAVAAVNAADEQMGACGAGGTACRDNDDCENGVTCDGYTAPILPVEAIEADQIPCQCESPLGETRERAYVCNAEGTGYDDCNCACNTEMARWITTYGREGRWVTDVSPFLAFFQGGGTHRLAMRSGNAYDFDFKIRLSSRGGSRPSDIRYLFRGGAFNQSYNQGREAFVYEPVAVPARVEIVAYVTGHGWGAEVANCAEFCNHTHHFSVNGTEFVKNHDWAGVSDGCAQQIADGVVPNQYGTWPYGRAGWCPGLDVKPWVVDITDALMSGQNEISYRGLFNGADYVPQPSGSGQGFGANVRMNSYLVMYE